jgi:5'-nucleotidase
MNKIIVVNDDGFDAVGIDLLAKAFMPYGEVVMYAPSVEQSAKSQAITLRHFKREEVTGRPYTCYKVDGTPADCVRLATGIHDDVKLVVSGINNGFNIGIDTLYSGTVGAALDANLHGISSMAFSAPRGKVIEFEKYLADTVKKCFELAEKFNGEMYCLNINFPKDSEHVLGYKITRVGYFVDDITMIEYNEGFRPAKYNLDYDKEDLTIDFTAQQAGYISISPLTCDKTNHKHYKLLNE